MSSKLRKIYHRTLQALDRWDPFAGLRPPSPPFSAVVAVGKVAPLLAIQAKDRCRQPWEGFVLTKEGHLSSAHRPRLLGCETWEAGHPLPDQRTLMATERLLRWLAATQRTEHLLLLISGGASSLLELPSPPLTLESLRAVQQALLASGWPIERVNLIRKHLSLVKGGQLGLHLERRFQRVTQLVVSDVCSRPDLHLVGSGPALADPSTLEEASWWLEQLGLPQPLLTLCRAALRETPKALPWQAETLADHRLLAQLAKQNSGLPLLELDPQEGTTVVLGEAREVAQSLAATARRLRSQGASGLLVATGEPTVTLSTHSVGQGGRCQELALHFARAIAGEPGLALLAGSSDGSDGPTPYAGAVVDGQSWNALIAQVGAAEAQRRLEQHDSSGLLRARPELLLETGPTGHNLNDLFLLSIDGPSTLEPLRQ